MEVSGRQSATRRGNSYECTEMHNHGEPRLFVETCRNITVMSERRVRGAKRLSE